MSYDYEQSIWGAGTASTAWGSPTSFRLRQALRAVAGCVSGGVVVEIGAGAGQFIRAIKHRRPDLVCHGSDISNTAIEQAKTYNDGVIYTLHASERLPYADASVDAVLIFDVLEHVLDPKLLLDEVHRILKPQGVFYAFVPCEGDGLSLWHLLDLLHLKRALTQKYAGHIQYFSRKNVKSLLQNSGFGLKYIRYSEHVFGQVLGVVAFFLMDRVAKRQNLGQINNEAGLSHVAPGGLGKVLRRIINTLVFFESMLLSRVPSPNMHVVVYKK